MTTALLIAYIANMDINFRDQYFFSAGKLMGVLLASFCAIFAHHRLATAESCINKMTLAPGKIAGTWNLDTQIQAFFQVSGQTALRQFQQRYQGLVPLEGSAEEPWSQRYNKAVDQLAVPVRVESAAPFDGSRSLKNLVKYLEVWKTLLMPEKFWESVLHDIDDAFLLDDELFEREAVSLVLNHIKSNDPLWQQMEPELQKRILLRFQITEAELRQGIDPKVKNVSELDPDLVVFVQLLRSFYQNRLESVRLHSVRVAFLTTLFWDANLIISPALSDASKIFASRFLGQMLHDLEKRKLEVLRLTSYAGRLSRVQETKVQVHVQDVRKTLFKLLKDPESGWAKILPFIHLPTVLKVMDPSLSSQSLHDILAAEFSPRGGVIPGRHHHEWDLDQFTLEGFVAKWADRLDAMLDYQRPYRQRTPYLPARWLAQLIWSPQDDKADSGTQYQLGQLFQNFVDSPSYQHYLWREIIPILYNLYQGSPTIPLAQYLMQPVWRQLTHIDRDVEAQLDQLFSFLIDLAAVPHESALRQHFHDHFQEPEFIMTMLALMRNLGRRIPQAVGSNQTELIQVVLDFLLEIAAPLFKSELKSPGASHSFKASLMQALSTKQLRAEKSSDQPTLAKSA